MSLLPHQPTLPATTRGGPGQPEGEMDTVLPQECGHQCSHLSAKEGSAREAVSAKLAPAREGDPTAVVCLPRVEGGSALGPGSLPQSLSKNLPWKVCSCLLASLSGLALWETGMDSGVPGREGITSAPHFTWRHSSAHSVADMVVGGGFSNSIS